MPTKSKKPAKRKRAAGPWDQAHTSFAISLSKVHRAFLREQAFDAAKRAGRPISVAEYIRRDIEAQMQAREVAKERAQAAATVVEKAG